MTLAAETSSGVPGLGAIPWGSHYCHFHDTRDDLIDTLVPYFKTGLDTRDACLWVTSESFGAVDARQSLAAHVPDLAERERRGQIEIIDHTDWYEKTGRTDARSTLEGWIERERIALADGYQGLRLAGNTYWLERSDWDSFVAYEGLVNETFRDHRIVGLCSYCFGRCSARDVLDVVGNHQVAIARRGDTWQVVESAALQLARRDLVKLRNAAEALRGADRRKDGFIVMLGHELRNPLAPITTAVQLMHLRGAAAPFAKELDTIQRQAKHLTRLGLPIVKSLVELHGGTLTIESPGVGTVVTITLPLTDAPAGQTDAATGAAVTAPERGGTRILLVDDNEDAAEMLGEVLASSGYEVTVALDPMEALRLAPEVRPEVAILDIGLPGMDGFELAQRLRLQPGLNDIPLIALTGYSGDGDRRKAMQAGFAHHLVKPIDVAALVRLLEELEQRGA